MAKKTTKTTKSTTSAKASASGVATATKPAKVTATKVTATKATATTRKSETCTPSYEQISQRAYEIWVAKGYPQGQDLENWKQAEAELMKGSLIAA